MKRHKILHIRDSSGIFGGERAIMCLARNLNPEIFDVTLLCMRRPDGRSEPLIRLAKSAGINVDAINVEARFDYQAISRLRELIRSNGISLIHAHDFKSNFYGVCATWNLGVRRVTTSHGSTRDSVRKKAYLLFDEYVTYRFYDRIVTVSVDLHEQLSKRLIRQDKLMIIQNGLDPDLLSIHGKTTDPPLPFEKGPGKKVFAVIGRLFPDKGHALFIKAFSRLIKECPDCIGVIAGDGPERDAVVGLIKSEGLEGKMHYCGVRKDIRGLYEVADCLVIPSFTEGLPYVLLEAMWNGIPVISTSVGDIPLLIEDGVTGYLVQPGDIEALAGRMMDLATHAGHVKQMGESGRKLIQESFSAKRMARLTEEVYLSLLG